MMHQRKILTDLLLQALAVIPPTPPPDGPGQYTVKTARRHKQLLDEITIVLHDEFLRLHQDPAPVVLAREQAKEAWQNT